MLVSWDMLSWCEEREIKFEPISPTYDKQRDGFKEIFTILREGRLKGPPCGTRGSRSSDIIQEEFINIDYDAEKKWFGSPEKDDKNGVQDDSCYSLNWCIFGGRNLAVEDLRSRGSSHFFGQMISNQEVKGRY